MRLRLNLKRACTTTMPPLFIDITHWDVSAVVLVLMLFTKWGPSNNQQGTNVAHNIMGGLQIIAMFHL